jgi:branched-chain amino acid transport system ATP-binding protein
VEDDSVEPGQLQLTELDAWYGQVQALYGIDLHVNEKEIVGLLGHNGAGKSTLLRSIARLHRKIKGSIDFGGTALAPMKPNEVAVLGVSLVREGARVFETLTVGENLQLAEQLAKRSGRKGRTTEEVLETFPMLKDRRESKAGHLSGGQRQAVSLAAAFISRPRCLLLDEPSTGLAPIIVEEVYATLSRLAEEGVSMLIAEQNPQWLGQVSSRRYVLESGRLVVS